MSRPVQRSNHRTVSWIRVAPTCVATTRLGASCRRSDGVTHDDDPRHQLPSVANEDKLTAVCTFSCGSLLLGVAVFWTVCYICYICRGRLWNRQGPGPPSPTGPHSMLPPPPPHKPPPPPTLPTPPTRSRPPSPGSLGGLALPMATFAAGALAGLVYARRSLAADRASLASLKNRLAEVVEHGHM